MKPPDSNHSEREGDPMPDEMLAMAYADGELDPQARVVFESRLADEPALAGQVAEYHSLALLAREMSPLEPADHEWGRLELDPLYRSGTQLGTFLLGAGSAGLLIWWVYRLTISDAALFPKACLLGLTVGALLLLLTTLQGRLRVMHFDPYRKVKR